MSKPKRHYELDARINMDMLPIDYYDANAMDTYLRDRVLRVLRYAAEYVRPDIDRRAIDDLIAELEEETND